jgi:hypothetical protein
MSKIIKIPEQELFVPPDRFINLKETTIKIEHSLVAISKWESKWHVPFLDPNTEKTNEMMIDYIRCMTITQNVDPMVYDFLPLDVLKEINEYIDDPMTATWFKNTPHGRNGEIVTSELVYYWMIAQNIPPEYDKWHFNRLMTLIRVCSEKNAPSKKMSKRDILGQNRALNAARRKASGSKG